MILGYHLIITAYGFWLPNDHRGSWSDFVGAWELLHFGRATKTESRQSLASRKHDVHIRLAAKKLLKYPEVHFTGNQARVIGDRFADLVNRNGLKIWACSILPEHAHLVVARHLYKVEQIANLLKGAATKALIEEKVHPFENNPTKKGRLPKTWAQGQWKVFLDSEKDIFRAIRYVEDNPLKEEKPRQRWSFVMDYE
jgi:REP element-mobilizing transposase RayT